MDSANGQGSLRYGCSKILVSGQDLRYGGHAPGLGRVRKVIYQSGGS